MIENSTFYKVILQHKGIRRMTHLPIIPRKGDSIHSPFPLHDNALIYVTLVLINPIDDENNIMADCLVNLDFT